MWKLMKYFWFLFKQLGELNCQYFDLQEEQVQEVQDENGLIPEI